MCPVAHVIKKHLTDSVLHGLRIFSKHTPRKCFLEALFKGKIFRGLQKDLLRKNEPSHGRINVCGYTRLIM